MKATNGVALVAAVGIALGMQGCATTGRAPGSTWEATGYNGSITTEASRNLPVVKASTKANFEAVESAIHKQMQPGGRWQFLSAPDRSTVNAHFADMQKLFDEYGSVDKMGPNSVEQLASDQSAINTVLGKEDGHRIVCRSELPVGSHLPVKICTTVAEQHERAQRTRQQLREIEQRSRYQGPISSAQTNGGGIR